MTYNAGQVKEIYPFLPRVPDWFILGGPADGDEAQCIARKFPGIHILAVEPSYRMRKWQRDNGFQGELVAGALSDSCGKGIIRIEAGQERTATMVLDRGGTNFSVQTYTLDDLSNWYGPFTDAILWLDIEGMEYRALLGAKQLFASEAVILVNVEVRQDEETTIGEAIDDLMVSYGFKEVSRWGEGGVALNWVYVQP